MVGTEGSTEGNPRKVEASFRVKGESKVSISAEVWRRYEVLLDTAKKLHDAGYNEAAIVLAQTACEVCTERVMVAAAAAGGKPRSKLQLSNYNLDRTNVRKLYTEVTGQDIRQDDPGRWDAFQEHVKRRHKVVHRGQPATAEDASASIKAVEYIIGRMLSNSP